MDHISLSQPFKTDQTSSHYGSLLSGRGLKGSEDSDPLIATVKKRGSDTLKLTHMMLRTRLSKDLDETLGDHFTTHPEMRTDAFIGIFPDGVEVVYKEEVKGFLEQLSEEERDNLGTDPIGYFTREQLPAKTPDTGPYQELQSKLKQYFRRNAEVFTYLRQNPETSIDPTTLYKTPGT